MGLTAEPGVDGQARHKNSVEKLKKCEDVGLLKQKEKKFAFVLAFLLEKSKIHAHFFRIWIF